MAFLAKLNFHFQRVLVMTTKAGIHTLHMAEFGIINFAVIFISHLCLRAIQSRTSSEVVDIEEAKLYIFALSILNWSNDSIGSVLRIEFLDLRIHADFGFASLVTSHTACFRTKVVNCETRGESHTAQGQSSNIMAGYTGNTRIPIFHRNGMIHSSNCTAVSA